LLIFVKMSKKAALIILDGWGIGNKSHSDAVFNANTPITDSLTQNYPCATLRTDGENVGLPDGQMGNSEVGHMNIGAGRVVWQMLAKINKDFKERTVSSNPTFLRAIETAKEQGSRLHLMGLVSDGGVHAHVDHAAGLCKIASEMGVENIYVHAFLDGRDTDPKSGAGFINHLENSMMGTSGKIATIVGRYFAMDRDLRWERVKKAYDLVVNGTGIAISNAVDAIQSRYETGMTDEFMEPLLLDSNGLIREGDTLVFFNFRTDRGREITRALTQEDFHEFNMHKLNLNFFTMTQYDEKFKVSGILYDNDNLVMTLGEVVAQANKTQLRAAETEKYPHVTFFFSGGREEAFEGEQRLMASSPKVATYDLQPQMSAVELTDRAVAAVRENKPDFICLNYANADMVGHTGVYSAIVTAVETVDTCLGRLLETLNELGYESIVIADHGNADFAVNDDGTPNTAHTTNPVPVWWINSRGKNVVRLNSGKLADVAPTILEILEVEQPVEMTGKSLIVHG
jgi:2,3-bisphosphoglycerate-independent phosphoglycerate mutase